MNNYFNSALFLIALSIGNSIYFFGRSHENNIINISASLIFVLYLFFDLTLNFRTKRKKILSLIFPSIFVLLITYFYSAGIIGKSKVQFTNLQKHQTIYPLSINPISLKINLIRELTNNSNMVYFIGDKDFYYYYYYYYYGNYVPQSYYFPYNSWIYKGDMINFIQSLLNEGYYVVSLPPMDNEIMLGLDFNKSVVNDGFKFVWKSQ